MIIQERQGCSPGGCILVLTFLILIGVAFAVLSLVTLLMIAIS